MKRAMIVCGVLAFVSGCALITIALGFSISTLVFLALGLAAIGAAVKYTFGKNPYGYAGLGDVSVFVFFGIVGVCGTFYLHTETFELAGAASGCCIRASERRSAQREQHARHRERRGERKTNVGGANG